MRPSVANIGLGFVAISALLVGASPALSQTHTPDQALLRLLAERQCAGCNLQDADLVHADLRGANLSNAQLQRANLSQGRLDGANLQGANLSFTSLQGAYLQGANLLGATLEGTDLRHADLSGASLSPGALSRTHWGQARGINHRSLSHSELHNAGVDAAQAGRFTDAERLFGEAIRRQPNAPVSWIARGLSRVEIGNAEEGARDFSYAASILTNQGDLVQAELIEQIAEKTASTPEDNKPKGNGAGIRMMSGSAGIAKFLLPLAAKAFLPLP